KMRAICGMSQGKRLLRRACLGNFARKDRERRRRMSRQLAEVKDEIRARILSGDYVAGTRLKEAHVATQLDTSRTIVKLAFTALENEGLLTPTETRGYRVASFSPEEV